MKIFANNFALGLTLKQSNPHFSFELQDWDQVTQKLLKDGPDFDGQVFYVDGEASQPSLAEIFEFHTHPAVPDLKTVIYLCFGDARNISSWYESYRQHFKLVIAGGGAVVNEREEMLLILRDEKWDLPKGKWEKGEAYAENALREVEEETGITGHSIISSLPETFHIYQLKKWVLKQTNWYLMKVNGTQNLVPQTIEGITKVVWRPLNDLRDEVPDTYPTIQETIRAAICEWQQLPQD